MSDNLNHKKGKRKLTIVHVIPLLKWVKQLGETADGSRSLNNEFYSQRWLEPLFGPLHYKRNILEVSWHH